jgi:anti-sigma regulatory factor (Ser/Thr protein kinase)
LVRAVIGLRSSGRRTSELSLAGGFAFSVEGGASAPGEARHIVAECLGEILAAAQIETVRLLVSEVTTNCVQHAHAGATERIDLVVSQRRGAVRVEVSTKGAPFEYAPSDETPADPTEERGRGLFIVDALSQRWGVAPNEPNRVWFEVDAA